MTSPNESMAQAEDCERAEANNAAPDDPPHHLNDDARSKWSETWSRLDHNRFDPVRDVDVLAEYCDAWADIRKAETEIQRLRQIAKTTIRTEMPEKISNKTSSFYLQRAAAMERLDRAGEKLGLSFGAPPTRPWADVVTVLKSFPQQLAAQDMRATDTTTPRRLPIWTCQRVWDALQRSFGNMAAAARLLSETYGVTCARSTISYLVKRYPQLREVIDECEETLLEACYDALAKSAGAGDGPSQRFLLCKLHPAFQGQAWK